MEETGNTINIFLIDDHEMFRQGLARLLEREPGMKIVGQSVSGSQALPRLKQSAANMVLLDVDLGNERGLDFVVEARKRGFAGHIMVVTAGLSGQEAVQLVQAGVGGILHKHQSADSLRDAIQRVAEGGAYLEESYLPSLFRSLDRTKGNQQPQLLNREKEILRFIFQGLTNKEISLRLASSEGAVKSALRQMFEKLGVRTRAQLVKIALEQYRDQL
jgi:two-component system, NarL family, nitrate/nitrite response regulator NarL